MGGEGCLVRAWQDPKAPPMLARTPSGADERVKKVYTTLQEITALLQPLHFLQRHQLVKLRRKPVVQLV